MTDSRGVLWLIGALALVSCDQDKPPAPQSSSPAESSTAAPAAAPPSAQVGSSASAIALLEQRQLCQYFYRGAILDLGDPDSQSRNMFTLANETPPSFREHAGESFRELDQMNNDFVFWTHAEVPEFEVQALVHGLESERMAVYIDGKRLGAAKLKQGETRVVKISGRALGLDRGRHRITIGLSRPKGSPPRSAVSWVRIGPPKTPEKDQPFTAKQLFSEVTIEEERQPSFIIQPGAKLRCAVYVAPGMRLATDVGIWGQGASESEIAVRTADGGRYVVFTEKREKQDPRTFRRAEIELARFESQWVDLEFQAHSAASAARTAFATPTLLTQDQTAQKPPRARRAIVIVLSGLSDEEHAPPQAGRHGLSVLNRLAPSATIFPNYRVSTSSSTGALASLLTGAAPWRHRLGDSSTVLPARIPTFASTIEANGGRSSFFTGAPTSFAGFGFDRGFEQFQATPPQKDEAAIAPLNAAKTWLTASLGHDGPVLSVIHLRGGHPPFDVSRDEARKLPPEEYGGDLTPRRAAIQLANIRARRLERHRQMPDEDWKRVQALQIAALAKQSDAIEEFIEWLRKEGAYRDTLLMIVGDVGAGNRPKIPFTDGDSLDEDHLAVPLLVKFPGEYQKNTHVSGNFAPRDLTRTIATSLGVAFSPEADAIDLHEKGASEAASARPHIALTAPNYAVKMGRALLQGKDRKAPSLCLPELDPLCATDRSELHLIESRALWFTTWSVLGPSLSDQEKPVPIEEDQELENALTVWGFHR